MYLIPSAELLSIAGELVGAGGEFSNVAISLWSNGPVPNKSSSLGQYTLVDEVGFTSNRPFSYGLPNLTVGGGAQSLGDLLTYHSNATPVTPVNILGYVVTDRAVTKILQIEQFATPFTLSTANQTLAVVPTLTIDD